MAPSIRLARSRGSTSNQASATASPTPAILDSSRRSSGRAAAAKIYQTSQQLADYDEGEDDDDDDDEDNGDDDDDEEEDEGQEAEIGQAHSPRRGGASGRTSTSRSRGQAKGNTLRIRATLSSRTSSSSRVPQAQNEEDDDDDDDDDDDEEDEDEPIADAAASASRSRGGAKGRGGSSRVVPRGRGRGGRAVSKASAPRGRQSDDEQDADDSRSTGQDDVDTRPPFKKRPSRLQGFSLVLDNSQTLLARISTSETGGDDKTRRGRPIPRGRGRPRKNRSQTTRIIEDSEDEDSDDDRPRPQDPNAVEVDDDHAVPPDEKFKVKILGKEWILDGDELELPSDPEGDKKIDANGNLLGGRIWKAAPFTSSLRANPHKVYLLSVDAARAVGYRDSLSLFRSHLRLVKLALLPQEKDDLIAAGRLNAQLRGRNVTITSAKSVFKVFGAKAIKNGRAVVDDYYEADAKAALERAGRPEEHGQIMETEDYRSNAERRRDADRERDRTRRPPDAHSVALYDFHGNLITTTFGDNGAPPFVRSSGWPSRRATQIRADLSEENWMLEMARNVQGMNSELAENRRERLMKFTDPVEGVNPAYAEEQQRLLEKRRKKEKQQLLLPGGPMEVDGTIAPEVSAPDSGIASPTIDLATAQQSEDDSDEEREDGQSGRYKDLTNPLAPPVGLYDPTTHLPHFSSNTQTGRAIIEKVAKRPYFLASADQDADVLTEEKGEQRNKRQRQRAVLLGARVGSTAMGVASWSTVVDVSALKGKDNVRVIPAGLAGGGDQ